MFVAVQRGGEVRATTMTDLKFGSMKPRLDAWVAGDPTLMTDEFKAYDRLGKFWKWHFRVRHGTEEFAREGRVQVNNAESFNATLKRAHTGIYHYTVRPFHLGDRLRRRGHGFERGAAQRPLRRAPDCRSAPG